MPNILMILTESVGLFMIRMTGSELRQHGLFISRTTDSGLLLKIDALSAYSMGDLDRCINYKKQAEPITPISPACFHYMRKEVGKRLIRNQTFQPVLCPVSLCLCRS